MNPIKHALMLLTLLVMQGCSTLVAVPAPAAPDATTSGASAAHAAWARVLNTFVNERGLVDFAALTRSPADLHTYVRFVADTQPTDIADPQERLAHHINAYNALSMFNVIDLGIPETNQPLVARYRFFIARKHIIGGQRMSLYAYENEVIRPLGEPRVHWVLNCSAHACPVLPKLAFTGPELESQLQAESIKFFSDPRNFSVDDAQRTVYLSEILSFFTGDFVPDHAPSLIAYANRYAPRQADTNYQVKFVPYDWTIANWKR